MIFNQDNSDLVGAINDTREMIANVYNAGETATSIYRPGELVIYAGYAAVVTAPIAVGDSFSWNTNISGTTVSTELYKWAKSTTGTFTLKTNTDTIHESRFVQRGRVCEVHFCIIRSGGFTAGTQVDLGTLSDMQLPPVNIRTVNGCGNAAYAATNVVYEILSSSNGTISATPTVNCTTILVDFVYTVD